SGWALNFGNPQGGVAGAPFFAYFLWQDKESKLPPGNPRQMSESIQPFDRLRANGGYASARELPSP
ncbi:MAG: hypothetical protein ACRCV9_00540, partial [Burkholderiaceae bacterium]